MAIIKKYNYKIKQLGETQYREVYAESREEADEEIEKILLPQSECKYVGRDTFPDSILDEAKKIIEDM